MVKNRNWQVRVEVAEQRRRETRQRKAKSEEKKASKALVQKFLEHLDQQQSQQQQDIAVGENVPSLHLWVDNPTILQQSAKSSPKTTPRKHQKHHNTKKEQALLWETLWKETDENDCESPVQSPRQSRRARSSSIESEGSCKKKAHPRSKHDAAGNSPHSSNNNRAGKNPLPLCRSQFMRGNCGTCKKGGCRYFHYVSSYRTLHSVVENRAAIEAAEQALPSANASMDMLYYVPIIAKSSTATSDHNSTTKWSESITEHLMKTQTPLASIVYVAMGSNLVYDRHQGGSLVSQEKKLQRPRETSWGSETSDGTVSTWAESSSSSITDQRSLSFSDAAEVITELKDLPDTLWEHVLSFLPESAVASCALVCRAWNRGPHSPHFWRELFKRRHWEMPQHDEEDENDVEDHQSLERRLYAQHYTVLRDVESLAAAVPSIVSSSPSGSNPHDRQEREVAYQAFGLREYAPRDACVGVESWAPSQVLAAYQECTLRLFGATPAYTHNRCKELVCVNIDPYKLTKKRNCSMDAVALDDTLIACLCHVESENRGNHHTLPANQQSSLMSASSILVVLNRDDFLMGENSAVTAKLGGNNARHDFVTDRLQVIDIGEAVLNYILSMDELDHRLLPLFDFLTSEDGHLADVAINVSRGSIVACGLGRFMLEVSICIPNIIDEVDDLDMEMVQLDRKLILISSTANAILWMGDSYVDGPFSTLPAAAVPAVLSRCYKRQRGNSSVVVGSILSSSLLICDMEKDGFVHPPRAIAKARQVRGELLSTQRQAVYRQFPSRSVLLTSSGVVAKDTLCQTVDGVEEIQSTLSFFSLDESVQPSTDMSLVLEEFFSHNREGALDEEEDGGVEDIDGHWFGETADAPSDRSINISENTDDERSTKQCVLIIVHISTRQEIGRVPLATRLDFRSLEPRLMTTSSDTVAMALGNLGIAIGGQDVRHLQFSLEDRADYLSKQEKKKKASRAKGRIKKDRFVRGMSTRA